MKKVININFQGRVIPIEETAYEMLTKYVESLRFFFANEEGRDEIINDIEGRIAELFGEVLKKGSTCIVDQDVDTIIGSMGRPEDFAAEEDNVKTQLGGEHRDKSYNAYNAGSKRLYRDENQKVLGGVCSGIANYINIDPLIVRILFIVFLGLTFWIYFILWIAVPASSSVVIGAQRKRLFRDPEGKIIAGVCAGLAQYFNVQSWVPRVVFLIPFFSFIFRWGHWGWWDFPHFLSFSFSPGSLVIYIIFWLILPEAKSAADKLEMKGEKVDLNNIKSTIQSDMVGFQDRAKKFGNDLKDRAQEISENISNTGKRAGAEAGAAARRSGSGIGRAIVLIMKIFVYFIISVVVFSVVASLFGIGVVTTGLLPAYSYVLDDGLQRWLLWGTLIFFIWVPVIGVVTWIIRRITRQKGNRGILVMTFVSLWVLGWICFINLLVQIQNEFRYKNLPAEQTVSISNQGIDKMEIKSASFGKYYNENSWFKIEPFSITDEDTVYVGNVRVRIVKSQNDSFGVTMVKMANGSTKNKAQSLSDNINYNIQQVDSVLMLDRGVAITKETKFRNQQVIVTVAVPVGKRILVRENVGWGNDVRVGFDNHDEDYFDWERNMESTSYNYDRDVEYVMTTTGLKRVHESLNEDNNDNDNSGDENNAIDEFRKSKEQLQKEKQDRLKELEKIERELQQTDTSGRYRYQPAPGAPEQKKTKPAVGTTNADVPNGMNDTAVYKYSL